MTKTVPRILILLQALLLTGVFTLEYLCGRYMTMMRIMLYKNRVLETHWNMEVITTVLAALLLTMAALYTLPLFRDSGPLLRRRLPQMILILLAIGTAIFTLMNDPATLRTYYAAVSLMTAVTILQAIQVARLKKNRD